MQNAKPHAVIVQQPRPVIVREQPTVIYERPAPVYVYERRPRGGVWVGGVYYP